MLKLSLEFIEEVLEGVQTIYTLMEPNLVHRDLLCFYEDRISLINLQRELIKPVWGGCQRMHDGIIRIEGLYIRRITNPMCHLRCINLEGFLKGDY